MSSYRDDLEAAHARADAAEQETARLKAEVARLTRRAVNATPEVPIPPRFDVRRTTDSLVVRWRWFRPQHLFLLFFAIAWDAFLLFWYFGPMSDAGGLLFKIFPIAHVAVGVGITYQVLTGFLNRTQVSASNGVLRVRHGPLPWRGNHSIPRADLEQLYVKTGVSKAKPGTGAWTLCALLESGREVWLVPGLESEEQARYLERAFERYLGIADSYVTGAHS